ncbi:MAG: hypothetical protein ABEJ99_05775 [Candidatus Nanohaloarchaea archaeon]
MRDPWKYLAFPAAAVGGFVLSSTSMAVFIKESAGLSQYFSQMVVVAISGLIFGFLVDEVIPAYVEKVRNGGSGMGDDMDMGDMGGGDDDFDF